MICLPCCHHYHHYRHRWGTTKGVLRFYYWIFIGWWLWSWIILCWATVEAVLFLVSCAVLLYRFARGDREEVHWQEYGDLLFFLAMDPNPPDDAPHHNAAFDPGMAGPRDWRPSDGPRV